MDKQTKLARLFEEARKLGIFSGVYGAYENGKTIFETANGLADRENMRQMATDGLFDLASVTKQFTCAAIMLLAQRGQLHADDPLSAYFPRIPYPGVTLRMLMNHTSGLPDEETLVPFVKNPNVPMSQSEFVAIVEAHAAPALFAAGQGWCYSNVAYEILASVVEAVSGRDFESYLMEEIFVPAGLKNTRVYHRFMDLPAPKAIVKSYVMENGHAIPPEKSAGRGWIIPLEGVNGAGLVYTNLADMRAWDLALRAGRILSPETQSQMRDSVACGNGEMYGMGWFVQNGGQRLYHSGGWPGFINYLYRDLDTDRMMLMLTNLQCDRHALESLRDEALKILSGGEAGPIQSVMRQADRNPDASAIARMRGHYEGNIRVAFEDGRLVMSGNDDVRHILTPVPGGAFLTTDDLNRYLPTDDGISVISSRDKRLIRRISAQ